MIQFPLNISSPPNYSEEDYLVTDANYSAKKWIDSWPDWGESKLNNITLIIGSSGSGKTHLASIWKNKSAALELDVNDLLDRSYMTNKCKVFLLENVERLLECEESIFHFFNYILNNGLYLVVTCSKSIKDVGFSLPDLLSRLSGFMHVKLHTPDVPMVEQILFKNFLDRHIKIERKTVEYLSKRVTRSYPSIKKLVEELDTLSLTNKTKLTIPFVQKTLGI